MLTRPKDRQNLEAIFRAGVAAVKGDQAVLRSLCCDDEKIVIGKSTFRLDSVRKIWLFGAGKAGASMAQGAEKFLLKNFNKEYVGGYMIVKEGHGLPLERAEVLEASHPIPDEKSLKATQKLLSRMDRDISTDDLVIFLLSGGASALLCAPAESISLAEMQNLNEMLLRCGANIHEMNIVRKACSEVKGGKLAQRVLQKGAQIATVTISDVPGDRPETIGSAPTVWSGAKSEDPMSVLRRYGLEAKISREVKDCFAKRKEGERARNNSPYTIIASNQTAVTAAREKAKSLGYRVEGRERFFSEDIQVVSKEWGRMALEMKSGDCVICGGEPTVKVKGDGKGGRNTELALRVAAGLSGIGKKFSFLSAGTDGTDGTTDAAGAFVDEETHARGKDIQGFLERNDSYSFFEDPGDLLRTGPTHTNVMDLQILLKS